MHRRSFFSLPFALAACAATPEPKEPRPEPQSTPTPQSTPSSTPGPGAQRFKGVWDFHFETSSFVAEDGAGPYWLSGEGDVWPTLTAPFGPTGRPWGRLAIEIEGELSAPGRYGHMGAYERELRVTRVISSRFLESR